jgi:adenosylmethionine-8-amino-7-oxononanoate aminotransferase
VGFNQGEIRTHSGRSALAQQLVDSLNEGKISEVFILEQFGWKGVETLMRYKTTFNRKGRKKVFKSLSIRRLQKESKN